MHATLHTPSATNSKQHEDACDLVMHPRPRTVRPAINRAAAFSETVRDFLNGKPSKPEQLPEPNLPAKRWLYSHRCFRTHRSASTLGGTQFSMHIGCCCVVELSLSWGRRAASTGEKAVLRAYMILWRSPGGVGFFAVLTASIWCVFFVVVIVSSHCHTAVI